MQEINFIVDKLDEIRRDLGISNYTGFLNNSREQLTKIAKDNRTHVDVYYCSTAIPDIRKLALSLPDTVSENDFCLHIQTEQNHQSRMFGEMLPAIAILLTDEDFMHCQSLVQLVQQRSSQYRYAVIIDYLNNEELLKQLQKKFISTFINTIPPPAPEYKFTDLLVSEKVNETTFQSINKIAKINTIAPLNNFLQDIIQSENLVIQTKKTLTSQQSNIIRKEEQLTNSNELSSFLKQKVQKATSDLEKHYRSKYEELNKPNIGKFSVLTSELSSKLEDFTREAIAEKNEKVSVKIDTEFQANFLKATESNLKEQFSQDGKYIKVIMDGLISDINNEFSSKGIKKVSLDDSDANFPEPTAILSAYNSLNKPYQGELLKKGISEYFVALRDYTGLIMVVAGILAPLNTVSSVANVPFLKSISVGIRITTGVITLAMVVYGVYDLRKRIPKKRKEEFERELGKAREVLNQEGKRIYNDCSKDWQSNLSNWVRDVGTKIVFQIEQNLKLTSQEKAQQFAKEKSNLQRFQQSVDSTQKNFSLAEKNKDLVVQKLRDTSNLVEKELKF